MLVRIPYYKDYMVADVAGLQNVTVLEPNQSVEATADPVKLVREALANPIGTMRLRDLAQGKGKVVIVTSDHTRPMPSLVTMPLLIEEIRRGSPDAEIVILVATGLHRPTTDEELRERFGAAIVEAERIVVHNAFEDECIDMGILPSGNSYAVNRIALEADLLVCEGYIEPHFFAGFSGGRKSILPGICAEETVRANHSSRTIDNKHAVTGVLEGNPIHEDAVYAARQVGVDFILNVALDLHKNMVAAFAGDLEQAHAEGCALVRRLFTVPKVMADVVVTSNGGYPLDQNLYQCAKAVSTAAQCVSPGGVIIMVASCSDGIGGTHFEKLMLRGDPAETLAFIRSLSDRDTISEQWNAQILLDVMVRHKVILVTQHLSHDVVRSMGITPAHTVDEALATALKIKGQGGQATVTFIPDGVSVMVSSRLRP